MKTAPDLVAYTCGRCGTIASVPAFGSPPDPGACPSGRSAGLSAGGWAQARCSSARPTLWDGRPWRPGRPWRCKDAPAQHAQARGAV